MTHTLNKAIKFRALDKDYNWIVDVLEMGFDQNGVKYIVHGLHSTRCHNFELIELVNLLDKPSK
jgi:hypothetical protein